MTAVGTPSTQRSQVCLSLLPLTFRGTIYVQSSYHRWPQFCGVLRINNITGLFP